MKAPPHGYFLVAGLGILCGFPALFGLSFCVTKFVSSGETRFLVSALGELLILIVLAVGFTRSIGWLCRFRQTYPVGNYELLINLVSTLYLVLIAITLANAQSVGLLSEGGRLDFYFENDWYRRIVSLSIMPAYLASYHSLTMLASPVFRGRRLCAIVNLVLLMAWSLLIGSRGGAVLVVATAGLSVVAQYRTIMTKFGVGITLACAAYLTLFLAVSSDPIASLLALVQRFYLSIDMSILLTDRADASAIAVNLNDLWIETFRNLQVFGTNPSPKPLGVVVYEHALGYPPATGANCRYASLLLLSPDRIDYLVGYPVLVLLAALAIETSLKFCGLAWSSRIASPYFAAQSFQDVYWFSTHLAPVLLLLVVLLSMRVAENAAVRRNPHPQ